MKYLSIVVILACILLAIVTGCSLVTSSNGNIATYGKTDILAMRGNLTNILGPSEGLLAVTLTPTNNAKAGITYTVDLYDKGVYRNSATVDWNQPELNTKESQYVYFPLSDEEFQAYSNCWAVGGCYLTDTFSVEVHEPYPTPTPATSTVIYKITGTADKVFVNVLVAPDGHIEQYHDVDIPKQYVYNSFPFYWVGLSAENEDIEGSVTVSIYVNGSLYATSTNSSEYAKASACGPILGTSKTDCY